MVIPLEAIVNIVSLFACQVKTSATALLPYFFVNNKRVGKFFEGYYVKCISKQIDVAFIFGRHKGKRNKSSFIQVITKEDSWYVEFDYNAYAVSKKPFFVSVGMNKVTADGLMIDIENEKIDIKCDLDFGVFRQIKYDAMGPFKIFPFMECRHKVISMDHTVSGYLLINGTEYEIEKAHGYIEGDRGKSFPKKYFWTQCNSFELKDLSVMSSCAVIPYCGLRFTGTICMICCGEREYRLATYLGARVKQFTKDKLVVKQGFGKRKKILEIRCLDTQKNMKELAAPVRGSMARVIKESIITNVRYRFSVGGKKVFEVTSDSAAFEYSDSPKQK